MSYCLASDAASRNVHDKFSFLRRRQLKTRLAGPSSTADHFQHVEATRSASKPSPTAARSFIGAGSSFQARVHRGSKCYRPKARSGDDPSSEPCPAQAQPPEPSQCMEGERPTLASRSSASTTRSVQPAAVASPQQKESHEARQQKFNSAAFWLLGLLNNSAYVIMIAGANEITSGAVGLTYLCAILPALAVKATGPYWFHYFSYGTRSWLIAGLMVLSYSSVAFSSSLPPQLFGVAVGSLQGGLGEASCLAMASFYDSRRVITFWSSGTGFAGVFGYSWVGLLHIAMKLSFKDTLLLANLSSLAWLGVYYLLLESPEKKAASRQLPRTSSEAPGTDDAFAGVELATNVPRDLLPEEQAFPLLNQGQAKAEDGRPDDILKLTRTRHMSFRERWDRTLDLWPYIAPLTLVYFAEYSMQAGTWTAIGFPVTDPHQRAAFYSASNWCYQLGVFVSRSSGLAFQANLKILWAMPILQLGLLVFFTLDAWLHFWYNYWLLILCLITGLLGGAVYVNAFTLISKEVDAKYREFSLSAASLGDSLGIAFADVTGILIQGCLFKVNGIPGADFTC